MTRWRVFLLSLTASLALAVLPTVLDVAQNPGGIFITDDGWQWQPILLTWFSWWWPLILLFLPVGYGIWWWRRN